jgi:hypothetical protein
MARVEHFREEGERFPKTPASCSDSRPTRREQGEFARNEDLRNLNVKERPRTHFDRTGKTQEVLGGLHTSGLVAFLMWELI